MLGLMKKELLKSMIEATERKDADEVKRLNDLFDMEFEIGKDSNEYDLTRQSCVLAFNYSNLYDKLLADAKRRYEKL